MVARFHELAVSQNMDMINCALCWIDDFHICILSAEAFFRAIFICCLYISILK